MFRIIMKDTCIVLTCCYSLVSCLTQYFLINILTNMAEIRHEISPQVFSPSLWMHKSSEKCNACDNFLKFFFANILNANSKKLSATDRRKIEEGVKYKRKESRRERSLKRGIMTRVKIARWLRKPTPMISNLLIVRARKIKYNKHNTSCNSNVLLI